MKPAHQNDKPSGHNTVMAFVAFGELLAVWGSYHFLGFEITVVFALALITVSQAVQTFA